MHEHVRDLYVIFLPLLRQPWGKAFFVLGKKRIKAYHVATAPLAEVQEMLREIEQMRKTGRY